MKATTGPKHRLLMVATMGANGMIWPGSRSCCCSRMFVVGETVGRFSCHAWKKWLLATTGGPDSEVYSEV